MLVSFKEKNILLSKAIRTIFEKCLNHLLNKLSTVHKLIISRSSLTFQQDLMYLLIMYYCIYLSNNNVFKT